MDSISKNSKATPPPSPSSGLFVFGAGGHGKVVADMATEAGWNVRGILDDDPAAFGRRVLDLSVLGGRDHIEKLVSSGDAVVIGIGNNRVRMQLQREFESLGVSAAAIVSPQAAVSKWARIGRGAVIMAGVIVNAGAVIGEGAILNTGAVIEHDCEIGEFAHLSPNCCLGGGARIGRLAHVGIGATVLPQVCLGAATILGAGAVANRDLPPDVIAFGVPARIQRPLAR